MATTLTNREVADVFYAIADTMEVLGEDRFRTQAYRRAGDAIVDLPEPLASYRERGKLEAIPGIGKAIAEKIRELLDTGQLQFYERLRAKVPAGVLEMLRVPNVGPRTAGRLYAELGIARLNNDPVAIGAAQTAVDQFWRNQGQTAQIVVDQASAGAGNGRNASGITTDPSAC